MKPTAINKKVSTQKKGNTYRDTRENGPRRGVKLSKNSKQFVFVYRKKIIFREKKRKKNVNESLADVFPMAQQARLFFFISLLTVPKIIINCACYAIREIHFSNAPLDTLLLRLTIKFT